jgi:Flp pilus assembly protein TadG
MSNTYHPARQHGSQRRGAIVVLVAILLPVLLGMVAFAVDIGHFTTTKTTLRAAADSAALGGAGAMSQSDDLAQVKAIAIEYAQKNVPESYGTVVGASNVAFGTWDPETRTFAAGGYQPNAIKVTAACTDAAGNPVSSFFGSIFGMEGMDMSVEAVAVAPVPNTTNWNSVYVTSTKDLSNVVLEFADGVHQKFEGLHGYTATFEGTGENAGKEIVRVWIKSGCNSSGEGPGYGERINNPQDASTVHGGPGSGCRPHVTATFQSTGVAFESSGSSSPVRLVH